MTPRRSAESRRRSAVDTVAVVLDLDDDVVAFLEGVERNRPDRRLADRLALAPRLDPVIDGVAHHVHERIAELLDDELVDLGLGAGDDEVHHLLGVAADLADDARELVEHLAERDHAHLEDALLHRAEVAIEGALQAVHVDAELARDVRDAQPLDEPRERGADDRELADDVHQAIELVDVDAHGLRDAADAPGSPRPGARGAMLRGEAEEEEERRRGGDRVDDHRRIERPAAPEGGPGSGVALCGAAGKLSPPSGRRATSSSSTPLPGEHAAELVGFEPEAIKMSSSMESASAPAPVGK